MPYNVSLDSDAFETSTFGFLLSFSISASKIFSIFLRPKNAIGAYLLRRLNIFDNLDGFKLINPCGNQDEKIAAVHSFNKEVSFDDIVLKINEVCV